MRQNSTKYGQPILIKSPCFACTLSAFGSSEQALSQLTILLTNWFLLQVPTFFHQLEMITEGK